MHIKAIKLRVMRYVAESGIFCSCTRVASSVVALLCKITQKHNNTKTVNITLDKNVMIYSSSDRQVTHRPPDVLGWLLLSHYPDRGMGFCSCVVSPSILLLSA